MPRAKQGSVRPYDKIIVNGAREHNHDVVKTADWIIDLGPEGGNQGGRIVAEGPPETTARSRQSYTGRCLKDLLPLHTVVNPRFGLDTHFSILYGFFPSTIHRVSVFIKIRLFLYTRTAKIDKFGNHPAKGIFHVQFRRVLSHANC